MRGPRPRRGRPCERQRDTAERARRAGAEGARRREQRRVDRLEGGDRGAHVERARDEGDGKDDRNLGEADLEAERVELVTEQPEAAERGQQPMPATAGGSTSGNSTSVIMNGLARKERVAIRYAAGVPSTMTPRGRSGWSSG